jgi:hypothetical protein
MRPLEHGDVKNAVVHLAEASEVEVGRLVEEGVTRYLEHG